MGQDQVSGGVSVPCWHATPVANAPWKPLIIGEGQAWYQCHEIGGKSDWLGSHCWSRIRMSFKVIPGEAGFRTDCFKIRVYKTKDIILLTSIIVSCPSGICLLSI